jgi:transposase
MAIVGGFDVHRAQITFDYLDVESGEVSTGRIIPADRPRLRQWLTRFEGCSGVAFAVKVSLVVGGRACCAGRSLSVGFC